MSFYKEVPGRKTTLESTLKFDIEPKAGSTNPVTSDGVAKGISQSLKDFEEVMYANLPCAASTLRFKFSKLDYDPIVAGVGGTGTWKKLITKSVNIWDWTDEHTNWRDVFKNAFKVNDNLVSVIAAGNTSAVTRTSAMFYNCTSLTSVSLFDTSAVTDMSAMFQNCESLTSVPLFDTSAATSMSAMFQNCTSLTSVPLFDTSAVKSMSSMLYNCTSLTSVPLFDTSAVTSMSAMLRNCTKVESGALALYQQASTQTVPPSSHSNAFTDCGKDTETGAAELRQIPRTWGGTGGF